MSDFHHIISIQSPSRQQNNIDKKSIRDQLNRLSQLTDILADYKCAKCAQMEYKIRLKQQQINQFQKNNSQMQKTLFQVKSQFNYSLQQIQKKYSMLNIDINHKIQQISKKIHPFQEQIKHITSQYSKHIMRPQIFSQKTNIPQLLQKKSNKKLKVQTNKEQQPNSYYIDKIIFQKLRKYENQSKQNPTNSSLKFENLKLISEIYQQNSQIRILTQKICYLIKIASKNIQFQSKQLQYLQQAAQFMLKNVIKIKKEAQMDSVRSSIILEEYQLLHQDNNFKKK